MSFEQLVLDIQESINQNSASPMQLTSVLKACLKQAEEFEEQWISDLYENTDGFNNFIY